MKARDIMSTRVVTISRDARITEAIRLMLQNRISGLPVVDAENNLVGIVTEGDFLRRAELGSETRRPRWLEFLMGPGRLADDYVRSHSRRVDEVMTSDVVSIGEEGELEQVVDLMERRRIKRLPVLRDGKIVGILSRSNLLHALARIASEVRPTTAADADIRGKVLAELQKQSWAPKVSLNVIVRDAIVDLKGIILDERERDALRVMVENVPGVKQVRDHLIWVEPMTGFVSDPGGEIAADNTSVAQTGAAKRS